MIRISEEMGFSPSTKVSELSVDQLCGIISEIVNKAADGNSLVRGIEGLSQMLNCSKASAMRLVKSGKIKNSEIRFGKVLNFDRKALLEALKN